MKAYHHPIVWIFVLIIALSIFIFINKIGRYRTISHVHIDESHMIKKESYPLPTQGTYTPQEFNLQKKLTWLSNNQIEQHKTLYKGYVSKRNEITEKLQAIDRTEKGSRTYSPFRALKIAETYAMNGSILHELYFENLGGTSQDIGSEMKKLIIDNFGSVESFKQDFLLCGSCARGWVITSFSLEDKRLHNFVLEEHNQNVPVLIIPLLVLDVYEHAYMIDFGIHRNPYLENFWHTIDWNIVEKRIQKWLKPFLKK